MKTKTYVIIPLALVTSNNLSVTVKTVYAVLKTFQKGKTAAHLNPSVVVTHGKIVLRATSALEVQSGLVISFRNHYGI
jgi:hypothetical protein